MGTRAIACTLLLLSCVLTQDVGAQEAPSRLRIFFDCQAPGCSDLDYLRRAITFVEWVRDRQSSDLHVLVSSQRTGSGGNRYTLDFLGAGDLEGREHSLSLSTAGDATTDEQRSALAERVKLGLIPYLGDSSVLDGLRVVSSEGPSDDEPDRNRISVVDDPWDFWVFRVSGNGFLNGQSTSSFTNLFGSASANRTTEALKLEVEASFSRNSQKFEFPDGEGGIRKVEETRRDWNLQASWVRSLGGRWAAGVVGELGSSTFLNQDRRWSAKPGVEFNFFPYAESSSRQLTLQYLVGPAYFDYTHETIFGHVEETLGQHSLTASLGLVQPWGRWDTSVSASQYLHDTGKYNVGINGNVNVRLFRGFSVRISGNYSWLRDQLFLSAEGATDEQILLQQRQLETSFRYFTSFGIEYRFGSIFNNVVNPRFGRSPRMFF